MKVLAESEKAKCVLWMHELNSPAAVQKKYRTYFNSRKSALSRKSIKKWYNELLVKGNMKGEKKGRKSLNETAVENVRRHFEENPRCSIRQASRELEMPFSSIQKTLRKTLKFYPYKIKLVHAMKPEDGPARVAFAETILDNTTDDPQYLEKICFSDEANFHLSGAVNRHNVRIWGTQNPREYTEKELNSPKVNVWCAVLHNRVIGPYFFEELTINQDSYLEMLNTFAFPILRTIPQLVFQQDGSPVHWGLRVRETLDRTFQHRWIGRGGPVAWPARSPDVTPLDFFLWGYVKDQVFKTPVFELDELKQRIRDAVMKVNLNMLRNTWRELRTRLEFLIENKGQHIEVHK